MPRSNLPILLRWASLTGLAAVALWILFSFRVPPLQQTVAIPVAEPPAPSLQEDSKGENDVVERSVRFEAEGTRGGSRSFLLRADETTTLRQDVTQLRGVELDLYQGPGAGLRVEARDGVYDAGSGAVALRGQVMVRKGGRVILRSDKLDYQDHPPLLRAASSLEFQAGEIEGTGSALEIHPEEERVEIEGPVFLRLRDPSLGKGFLRGRSWHLTYYPPERRLVLRGDASLWHGGNRVHAWFLDLELPPPEGPEGKISGESAVALSQRGDSEGLFGKTGSDRLRAGFRSGREFLLSNLFLEGAVRGADPDRLFRAESAHYSRNLRRVVLLGSGANSRRVRTETPNRVVVAERIEFLDRGRDLHAVGNVETHLADVPEGGGGIPFPFESGDPVTVYSGELQTFSRGGRILFSGGVMAWQGDRQIQAEQIQVEEAIGRLEARDSVLTRFPLGEDPDGREPGESPPHMTIRSRELDYDRDRRIARYEGNARMDRGPATITADRIVAEIARGGERIQRVVLEGRVRLRQGERSGNAERGVYLPIEDLLVLSQRHGFVELRDPVQGRFLRGKRLTFDLSDDKMAVETGRRGRIWMGLTPDRGDMESVDAKASH